MFTPTPSGPAVKLAPQGCRRALVLAILRDGFIRLQDLCLPLEIPVAALYDPDSIEQDVENSRSGPSEGQAAQLLTCTRWPLPASGSNSTGLGLIKVRFVKVTPPGNRTPVRYQLRGLFNEDVHAGLPGQSTELPNKGDRLLVLYDPTTFTGADKLPPGTIPGNPIPGVVSSARLYYGPGLDTWADKQDWH